MVALGEGAIIALASIATLILSRCRFSIRTGDNGSLRYGCGFTENVLCPERSRPPKPKLQHIDYFELFDVKTWICNI
jgi:hypothetical protein